ncbi:response regulator [Hymenobacter glaciei]|uniref:Response regulator n=1 Tax=Hymenobacter glaciei TaxID=877209 RepID=A0ABP7U7G2_9BACT
MRKLSTILLVDDNEITNFLHERLFERCNVFDQVLMAANGAKALDVLARQRDQFGSANPVLVLLDLNMPVMNGFQFLEAFRALPPAHQQGVVVVVLTSSENVQDFDRASALPIAGLLDKPLDQAKIDTLLQLYSGLPTAAE